MKTTILPMLIMAIILAACSQPAAGGVLGQVTPPARPAADKGTVVGQVVDKTSGEPLVDVIVRLAEVHREGEGGVFVLNHASSPGIRTNAQGIFIFENIPTGEYVMAVGEGENINDYDIIEDETGRVAKVWVVNSGEITDWGVSRAEVVFR